MIRRLANDRRAVTSVELGLVALPFLMVLFAGIEFALAVRMRSALQYAVTDAARCAAVNRTVCDTAQKIQAYAYSRMQGVSVPANSFVSSNQSCGREVSASVPFPVVAHSVMPHVYTLAVRSCYPP